MVVNNCLYYFVYRSPSCHTNNEIVEAIVDEIKNFVFDSGGITLSSQGYSGVPLCGETSLPTREDDLWKIVDILFKTSVQFENAVFRIATSSHEDNLFYLEAERNDVLPKWVTSAEDFNDRVYGYGGVLHVISPELRQKFPALSDIEIIRSNSRDTRNILVTEAVKQKLVTAASRDFGMRKMSVNLPGHLAYIARQRPELLSTAIREFDAAGGYKNEVMERQLSECDDIVVHVHLNSTDFQTVTALADIEMPFDIVSHRIARALIAFDRRHSAIQNGLNSAYDTQLFGKVSDAFERERLVYLFSTLFNQRSSLTHTYQVAKACVSSRHIADCKRLFRGEDLLSNEAQDTECSGDDEGETKVRENKHHVCRKRRGDLGKKRHLAPIVRESQHLVCGEDVAPSSSTSGQLRHFERAVNGDDVYQESSDDSDFGEEEDMDLFVAKPKPRSRKKAPNDLQTPAELMISEEEGGFDVSEVMSALPPIACADEDFDDI
ncbi:unnamed protein product [Nippostrongylus brasiliensis]|uniref:Protein ecdysoneless n=1 Tax=Nippostrongylus brasiliensis TaxID=27835 RepID=A0A0N4XTL2_NIPBR|nr:unnamed protein product [Nippostrongylus brasiliensis]